MRGLMQQHSLLSFTIRHAARHHGTTEVVSQMSETVRHRTTYAEMERRARRLVRVLQRQQWQDYPLSLSPDEPSLKATSPTGPQAPA